LAIPAQITTTDDLVSSFQIARAPEIQGSRGRKRG